MYQASTCPGIRLYRDLCASKEYVGGAIKVEAQDSLQCGSAFAEEACAQVVV
jgi:hypothetical protein